MKTYNQTSNYESGDEGDELFFEDIEITDLNGDFQPEITGYMSMDGNELMMVDIDRDGIFDIGCADYDGDGEYDLDKMEDISDYNIEVNDFLCGLSDDNPFEVVEFGAEVALIDLLDESQLDFNEDVYMDDFMSLDL